jgi:hypothetical protein
MALSIFSGASIKADDDSLQFDKRSGLRTVEVLNFGKALELKHTHFLVIRVDTGEHHSFIAELI